MSEKQQNYDNSSSINNKLSHNDFNSSNPSGGVLSSSSNLMNRNNDNSAPANPNIEPISYNEETIHKVNNLKLSFKFVEKKLKQKTKKDNSSRRLGRWKDFNFSAIRSGQISIGLFLSYCRNRLHSK